MREILSPEQATEALRRIASEVLSKCGGPKELALVGIRRGGVPLAEHIARAIADETSCEVPIGSVDITLYRDDAQLPLANPRIGRSEVGFDVTLKRIVLVDDVLFTGRTVRAALHALLDYGRAHSIQLAVLIDRGGRELPIQPDYVGRRIELATGRVEVVAADAGFRAVAVDE